MRIQQHRSYVRSIFQDLDRELARAADYNDVPPELDRYEQTIEDEQLDNLRSYKRSRQILLSDDNG